MVINFDKHSEPGTHWAALYSDSPTHVYYFDSLGLGITEIDDIKNYVWSNFVTSTQQHMGLQSKNSTVCGHYAIFFIYACALGIPFRKIEALLYTRKNPDQYVFNYVNNKIRK